MNLNQLYDNLGAVRNRKRICRGVGSGKGKTGGRGIKGQNSRSGVAINSFEGGQMPLHMRLPKRGFKNLKIKKYSFLNLNLLQKFINDNKIAIKEPITESTLVNNGVVSNLRDGVRILGEGNIITKFDIYVTSASKSAIKAIKSCGGKVHVISK